MAKHKQLWLKGSKGKLAGTTFYQTAGVTIQREINYDPTNPRTDKQMTQRTKLANLVNMYRAAKDFFPRAFENKKPLESDYNKFVSNNLTASPVYLTKGDAAKGIFVPDVYRVSQGSLSSLEGCAVSSKNITVLGYVTGAVTANATVAQFSAAFMEEFEGAQLGDQVSVIVWVQSASGCLFEKKEVILSDTDTRLMSTIFTGEAKWDSAGSITISGASKNVGAAVLLSRTIAGKTLVSSEQLVCVTDYQHTSYVGESARIAAINSYGASKKVFLDNK